jgi:enoyl-CoA hydratase/carnithine racemase
VCAVRGWAAGIGLHLVLAADRRRAGYRQIYLGARGVECRLDPSLQRQLRRIFERLIVIFLGTADAMLAGDSPPMDIA